MYAGFTIMGLIFVAFIHFLILPSVSSPLMLSLPLTPNIVVIAYLLPTYYNVSRLLSSSGDATARLNDATQPTAPTISPGI
jgi:hypothetical protein